MTTALLPLKVFSVKLCVWDWVALALFCLMLPELLLAPIFTDQGIYLDIARRVIASGELPYIAGWDHKGPLFHLVFTAIYALGGYVGLQVFDLALLAGFTLALWSLVRQLSSSPRAAALTVIFWLTFAHLTFVGIMQPDLWGSYLVFVLLYLLRDECLLAPRWRFGLSGFVLGVLAFFKLPFLCFGLLPLVAVYNQKRGLQDVLWVGVGFAIPVLFMVSLYAAAGHLQELFDIYVRFNLEVHGQLIDRQPLSLFERVLKSFMIESGFPTAGLAEWLMSIWNLACIAFLLSVSMGYVYLRKTAPSMARLLLTFLLAGALTVGVQGRFYETHFFPYIIPAVILAGCAFPAAPQTIWRPILLALVLLHGSWWLFGPGHSYVFGLARMAGLMSQEQYQEVHLYDIYNGTKIQAAVNEIKRRSAPDDQVVVWGFYQTVPMLAERSSPTRFGFDYPLVMASRWQGAWRAEYLAALQATPPQLILVQRDDSHLVIPLSSVEALEQFPDFKAFLAARYQRAHQDALFDYYERVSGNGLNSSNR